MLARASEQRGSGMDEKIEAVARVLCSFDGANPDEITEVIDGHVGFRTIAGKPSSEKALLWKKYEAEGRRLVVAVEAMEPFFKREARW